MATIYYDVRYNYCDVIAKFTNDLIPTLLQLMKLCSRNGLGRRGP